MAKMFMVKMLDTQILSLLWVPQHLVHADIRTYIILPHNYCLQGYLPGWNVTPHQRIRPYHIPLINSAHSTEPGMYIEAQLNEVKLRY